MELKKKLDKDFRKTIAFSTNQDIHSLFHVVKFGPIFFLEILQYG